jgi:hypothetical protein
MLPRMAIEGDKEKYLSGGLNSSGMPAVRKKRPRAASDVQAQTEAKRAQLAVEATAAKKAAEEKKLKAKAKKERQKAAAAAAAKAAAAKAAKAAAAKAAAAKAAEAKAAEAKAAEAKAAEAKAISARSRTVAGAPNSWAAAWQNLPAEHAWQVLPDEAKHRIERSAERAKSTAKAAIKDAEYNRFANEVLEQASPSATRAKREKETSAIENEAIVERAKAEIRLQAEAEMAKMQTQLTQSMRFPDQTSSLSAHSSTRAPTLPYSYLLHL